MSKIYAAYGSNIHPIVIERWAPEAKEVGVGIINNYALCFREGLATVEPEEGKWVPIKLYEITEKDEKGLDEYEGFAYGLYSKENLPIEIKAYDKDYIAMTLNSNEAMFYIMNKKYNRRPPEKEYLKTILYGYMQTEKKYGLNLFSGTTLQDAFMSYNLS